MDRLDRNVRFFGSEGQSRLRKLRVGIVGVGGLGTHVVQQLSYLGVGSLTLIDDETLETTNKNRYVAAYDADAPGAKKSDLGARLARMIDPSIAVTPLFTSLRSSAAFAALKESACVVGCVDNDGARLVLTELCAAYGLPYFDLATEIQPGAQPIYGGRLCVALGGNGCPVCLGLLNLTEAQSDLNSDAARCDRALLYGVQQPSEAAPGPSVVSINAVVASLAVTELMAWATGLRAPHRLLTYRADLGRVTVSIDAAGPECYYCQEIHGLRERADTERFLAT